MEERIQKILSHAGVASRRTAETLIADGRVTVNGHTVSELGSKADLATDDIRVDGRRVKSDARRRYVLLYKPRGVVTTLSDPQRRRTVMDLLRGVTEYVYPVGRLDYDTEGLLILTNDGELANKVMHPSGGVIKRYEIILNRDYDPTLTPRLLKGAVEEGEHLRFKKVIRHPDNAAHLEVHLDQGRKREIRRLFEIFGFHVKTLRRFQIGGLVLRKMPLGDCRPLSRKEIDSIFEN